MFSPTSPLWGNLVLFAGLLIAWYAVHSSKTKSYNAAIKKYEADMAAYEAAVAAMQSASVAVAPKELLLYDVDEKTAATLIAIVCDAIKGDPGKLDFVSIKKR